MRKDIHPSNYQFVVFQDDAAGFAFLTHATATSEETIKWEDGNTYPLVKIHISSASHPFYTGQEKLMDIEGRVDRFKARQAAASERTAARGNKAVKAQKAAEKKAAKETDAK
jgi:large subunit ribosomal protein L31